MTGDVTAYYLHQHGDAPVVVRTVEEMDRLIDDLLSQPFDNSVCTMYSSARPDRPNGFPDHEFAVAVNPEDAVGGLWFDDFDANWYTLGTPSRHDQVSYYYMESERDFPHDSEIPLALVRQAAREFLVSGGQRPTCVSWQRVPPPDLR
ncbi:Imm1 family immunity protein [Plantactinospora sp. WMMC1484]|uniref:Imm1 family immunity protein n=1 Tax=Plantactinospora sp. WMMC1484 TaxID=3404122 RepID=UPI003BF52745